MLVINRKLRIANDVDEENVRNLKLDLFLDHCGHEREFPGVVVARIISLLSGGSRRKRRCVAQRRACKCTVLHAEL
jgi:hypothetical protein